MYTSPVLAQQATQADSNSTAVAQSGNPFADVPANSWAYQAVKALAADGLVEGYPNGKFEGNRPMTRYEMAVLINRAVDKMEAQIAAGQKQNAADIATLKKLVDAFSAELKAVQDHVAALDTKVAAIDAAEKADAALLKRQQFHLVSFLRAPGSVGYATSAYAGPAGVTAASGAAGGGIPAGGGLPGATALKFNDALGGPGGVAPQNTAFTGMYTYGTSYMVNRLYFTGDVDANSSYAFRIENRYYMDTPNYGDPAFTTGNEGSSPNYCTSLSAFTTLPTGSATSCSPSSDFPTNTTFRLNFANYTWHPPGGFYVTAGRLGLGDGGSDLGGQPPNLLYSDYFNGAQIGYFGPKDGILPTLRIEAGYGFGAPSVEAPVGVTQQQLWGQASYDFIPQHLNVGAAYMSEIGNNVVLWDASSPILATATSGTIVKGTALPGVSGLYCGVSTDPTTGCPKFYGTNMTFGSVFLTYRLSDYLHVNAEGVHHFGNDPFTGSNWAQPNGFWGIVTIGNNAGPKGTPWADAGYIATGFNGESVEGGVTSTTTYFPIYIANPAGYYFYYGSIHYKVANNVDISVIGLHGDILQGTAMPASTQSCPGCFITHNSISAVYLQTLFSF